jgi:F-type H+-transporting ATPase subunit a
MSAEGHSDVFHHIRDAEVFELPQFLGGELHIPQPFAQLGFRITKFMLIEVLVVILGVLIFRGLAKRVATGEPVKGRFWGFWEAILLFLRDEVVRPTFGTGHDHGHDDHGHGHGDHGHDSHGHAAPQHAHMDAHHGDAGHHGHGAPAHAGGSALAAVGHPADEYLPFIWSVFFFILFCNLLGAVPWLGSPTGHIAVTGVLAACTLAMTVLTGTKELGFLGFLKSLVPAMDVPFPLNIAIAILMWLIEFIGLIIKHGVLSIRLFANIMAGHTVIAVILGFIAQVAAAGWLWWVVTPASILAQVGIGMLELFVAFLQAYVFAYLSTLFIAGAKHPH